MTAALSLEVRRRAPLSREELRRQLLALVLTLVLVWYTLVVPASGAAPRRVELDEEGDGEVRRVKNPSRPDEDLDWPEYIYP